MYWDHQKQGRSLLQFWRSRPANKLAGKYGLRQTIRQRRKVVDVIISYHIYMPIALAEKILISALLLGKYRLLQTTRQRQRMLHDCYLSQFTANSIALCFTHNESTGIDVPTFYCWFSLPVILPWTVVVVETDPSLI